MSNSTTTLLATIAVQVAICALCHASAADAQTPPPPVVFSQTTANSLVDADMLYFSGSVLPGARASGCAFPAYNKWLGDVASKLDGGTVSDPAYAQDAAAAMTELKPFIPVTVADPTRPSTKDTGLLANQDEHRNLAGVGGLVFQQLSPQAETVRSDASSHLSGTYSLPTTGGTMIIPADLGTSSNDPTAAAASPKCF